jgi:hypothetical protein
MEATTDQREIKRAYTRKLKAIDVEADAEAFIALRRAYDTALVMAAGAHAQAANETPEKAAPLPQMNLSPSLEKAAPQPQRDADPTWAVDDNDLHRLATLLYETGDAAAAAPEIQALIDKIAKQLPLEHLDRASQIEWWLAETIVRTSPRSDFILTTVISQLKWNRHDGALRVHPAIRAVLQRESDLAFKTRIALPDYNWSRAYRALSSPPPTNSRVAQGALREEVRGLLTVVHRDHPTLVSDFNETSLQWWTQRVTLQSPPQSGKPSFGPVRLAFTFAYFLFISTMVSNFFAAMPDLSGYLTRCIASIAAITLFMTVIYLHSRAKGRHIDRRIIFILIAACALYIFIVPPILVTNSAP